MVKINHQTTKHNITIKHSSKLSVNNDNELLLIGEESSNDVIHVIDTSNKTVKNYQDNSNTDIQFSSNSVIDSTIDDEDYIYTLHADKVTRTKYESQQEINQDNYVIMPLNDAVTNSNKINYSSYPKISTGINTHEYVTGVGSFGAIFTISVDEIELDSSISNNTIPSWFSKYENIANETIAVYITSYNNTGASDPFELTTGHAILSEYIQSKLTPIKYYLKISAGSKYNIFTDASGTTQLTFSASASENLLITSANGYIDHPGHTYK